ncbi:MAG: MMPL family transporter, partial [Candidatus Rokubacteria bacterium]|nr:MMPL family transporter [Candidatus Rokubacteria bacterium]
YFFSEDKRFLFVFVEPLSQKDSFTDNQEVIGAIRAAITRLREEFPGVRAGVTGAPALANDEMVTAFRDSQLALALAFAATLGLLVVRFRRVGTPLLLLATLTASLAWSVGIVTLTVGHLNIFSVMFLPIVVGVGIDYGTYLFFRYEEELGPGRPAAGALARAAASTGPGILLGAATASGTFYVLVLTEFRGIQEFGFVSGTAILAAFVAMLTLFPALLVLAERRRARPRGAGTMGAGLVLLLERLARRPAAVLGFAGLLTVASLWGLHGVEFDYKLLNLQASGTESVIWEEKLLADAGRSGFVALSTTRTLEEVRRKREAFQALHSVSRVETILKLIPDRQPEKIGLIREFAPLVEGVRFGEPGALDARQLRTALRTLERRMDLAVTEAPGASPEIRAVLMEVRRLLESLDRKPPGPIRTALEPFQAEVYRDFVNKFRKLQRNLDPRPLGPDDAPPELRQKYVGRSGLFLLRIHPGVDIWSREGAERFVRDLRSVEPDATGSAVINYEAIRLMEKGYSQGMLLASLLVGGLSILLLGRLREAMLALAPLGLATLWTVGLVYLLGLKFNLANVWGLPLVFGTAAEYGLNVVVRWMEARAHGGPVLARSTVMAVVLNGLTTIAGFGSLMVADHRGIFSLGLLLTIGAGASLIASLVVLPALINLFGQPTPLPVQERATPGASHAPGDGSLSGRR